MKQADPVLAHWHFLCEADGGSTVLPDGCRDLILHLDNGGHPRWFVSELAASADWVPSRRGETFMGWRLQPAARIDEARLLAALATPSAADPARAHAVLREHVQVDPRLDEMLHGLASAAGVGPAARLLGVHERSLERWVGQATGRPPGFWQGLARARRAARSLHEGRPLAELALAQGYADQAHMNRAFRRWFGQTPAALRRTPALLATLLEPGFN